MTDAPGQTDETRPSLPSPDGTTDPWQWLEDVTGDEPLAWVRERNAEAESELDAEPITDELQDQLVAILDATDKIPHVGVHGDFVYNLWTDAEHVRGLWRRTTMASYRTDAPEWEVLLDLDELSEAEGEKWVWHGSQFLRPAEGEPYARVLVTLSRGGADADVTREFDLTTRSFVPEGEGGFVRPEAKGEAVWMDADTLLVATDFGPDTMTTSGYPRQVRRWRRGTPLAEAELLFEAAVEDMVASPWHDDSADHERWGVVQMHAFYNTTTHVLDPTSGELTALDLPRDLEVDIHRGLLVLRPRSDWAYAGRTHPAGSVAVADLAEFLAGDAEPTTLFEPTDKVFLDDITLTRNCVVLAVLEDVVQRLEVHTRDDAGQWRRTELGLDALGLGRLDSVHVRPYDADADDRVWLDASGFTTPLGLLLADVGDAEFATEEIKTTPERFDATGLVVSQHFATSEDGTRVPYFQVGPEAPAAGPAPTMLYGYGGFEISLPPGYQPVMGKAWLERGGTYVLANIRGGGEYGPAWHQAALKQHRHRAYEDFAAVARDLARRGVTDAPHLVTHGGSNGGLLTGNMLTHYPELFGAVVIQVPLLDMKRYSHLLAGASWMAEYGDPDTEDWDFIQSFSPYHLLREDVAYPPSFVLTSTRDDRVHPGHARKFAAALRSLGADVRSWENIEGGHGGAATNEQRARMSALMYAFAWRVVGS